MLDVLEGYTIAVTADRRAREQAELLERRGATIVRAPAISTPAVSEEDATRAATRRLLDAPPDYIVANTGAGIRSWVGAACAWGWDENLISLFETARVVARGPAAAGAVTALGVSVAWQAPSERLREVVAYLVDQPIRGTCIAFQQHGEDAAATTEPLRQAGAHVVEVPVYRWTLPGDMEPLRKLVDAIADQRVDAVTFTSAPSVHNLFSVAGDTRRAAMCHAFEEGEVQAVAVGPVTAEALRAEGAHRLVAPQLGRLGAMVRVLTEALEHRRIEIGRGVVVQGTLVAGPAHRAVLTDNERTLMRALVAKPGAVVPRERLAAPGEERALEAAVHRLRRKLGPAAAELTTIAKRGYRLTVRS